MLTMELFWNTLLLICCSEGLPLALAVLPALELDTTEVNVTSVEGSTAVLPCSIKNLGFRTATWLYGGKVLTISESVFTDDPRVIVERRRYTTTSYEDLNLHIRDVRASDSGQYKCQIGSRTGLKSKSVYLEVKANNPKDRYTVEEGEMVLLPCNIENATKDTVVWKKDEMEVSLGEVYGSADTRITVRKNGNLLIEGVERRHWGVYTCHMPANNLVSDSVSLRVTAASADKQPQRIFLTGTRLVAVHNDIHLVCFNKGMIDFFPKVGWFRSGYPIHSTSRIEIMLEKLMMRDKYISEVIIHDARLSDTGTYVCRSQSLDIADINVMVTSQTTEKPQVETGTTTTTTPVTTVTVPVTTVTKSVNCTNDNAKEKTTDASTGEKISNEMLQETRLEFYRSRILTDRKRRNIMDLQQIYYRTMLKYLQKQDLAKNETEMLTILVP